MDELRVMLIIEGEAIDDALKLPELPVSPESTGVNFLKIDIADDTEKWWGLYQLNNTLYRGKPHCYVP